MALVGGGLPARPELTPEEIAEFDLPPARYAQHVAGEVAIRFRRAEKDGPLLPACWVCDADLTDLSAIALRSANAIRAASRLHSTIQAELEEKEAERGRR